MLFLQALEVGLGLMLGIEIIMGLCIALGHIMKEWKK